MEHSPPSIEFIVTHGYLSFMSIRRTCARVYIVTNYFYYSMLFYTSAGGISPRDLQGACALRYKTFGPAFGPNLGRQITLPLRSASSFSQDVIIHIFMIRALLF